MKVLKRMTAVMAAGALLLVGNIGILPESVTEKFAIEVSAAGTIVASGECGAQGDNLTWTLDSEGTLTICGEGEMADWGLNSKLPWGDCDFTKVIIKEGVTSIGTYAFRSCDNLNYITIPYSVTSIGDISNGALYGCQNLMFINVDINNKYYATEDDVLFNKDKTLLIQYPTGKTEEEYVIPDSVTSIGTDAFHFCKSLTSITIPDSVTSIGSFAFSFCDNLTSITIPDSVASIGREAFYHCGNLTSVTASGDINKIGYNTFTGTPWLREKRKENPLVILGRTLIDGQTCEGNVVIPDSVTNIGDYAFDKCDSLTSITIPDNVTSIGDDAFRSCDSLTSITILDSVTSIGKEAFYYCENLDSVTIPDSVTGIGYRAFLGCKSLTDIYYNGTEEEWNAITIESGNDRLFDSDVTIHYNYNSSEKEIIDSGTCGADGDNLTWTLDSEGTLTISGVGEMMNYNKDGGGPFAGNINKVIVNDNVTTIGDYAFLFSSFSEIVLPDSIKSIGDSAFEYCELLTSIVIPDNVSSIGDSAFYNCSNLTSITIPDSVSSIGGNVFGKTAWLDLKIKENPLVIVNDILIDGTNCEGNVVIHDGVTSIGEYAFFGCYKVISVKLPTSVINIEKSAFFGCGLNSITVPDGVISIKDSAFAHCNNLADIYYSGTEEEWNNIKIESGNDRLYGKRQPVQWA